MNIKLVRTFSPQSNKKQIIAKWTPTITDKKKQGNKENRLIMTKQKYQMIPSGHIDHQKILAFDWFNGMHGHTQTRVALSNATFP